MVPAPWHTFPHSRLSVELRLTPLPPHKHTTQNPPQTSESWLIIGGGGFVGHNLTKMLLDRGETSVTIIDLRPPRIAPDPRLTAFLTGDICDPDAIRSACRGKTVVVHTASPIEGLGANVYWKVNVEGTKNVVDACVAEGVKKLVFTSSASVNYNGQDVRNGREEVPYCDVPMNAYNETKAIAEDYVLKANGRGGLLTVALRPSAIFGPGDTQACLNLTAAARKGNWKFMIGDNSCIFDWTFVDNVSHAHILAAKRLGDEVGPAGKAYQITNDEPIFFWDIARKFYDGLGYKHPLQYSIPKPVGLLLGRFVDTIKWAVSPIVQINPTFTHFRVKVITNNRYLDISAAKRDLGYKPIVSLEEALRRSIEYWKTR
ncbi:3-beta hydroxysteroid dehydrogenase/isomerase family-domain-containing protein [Blyttiomyces helicus]|uniref:3-beta hydroxysteroid dehydrogenase/isomerase family-domain-containing protein n=1 Tax=Blyttiomyces helicus TaxID=388810 RepID=A0A4P9W2T4_9FUNG|nr:3-beta hydroxysteroid dehydrogenase/isomerase family-domain-containing protein [Blyttiomyces helicus]|eukprot:RKO85118.1 3-beta hydroxysteroid dehydrogenase/isomerase family-domain-containing protein [Blyttiomyces helicus]